jgi:hypothetical protein
MIHPGTGAHEEENKNWQEIKEEKNGGKKKEEVGDLIH